MSINSQHPENPLTFEEIRQWLVQASIVPADAFNSDRPIPEQLRAAMRSSTAERAVASGHIGNILSVLKSYEEPALWRQHADALLALSSAHSTPPEQRRALVEEVTDAILDDSADVLAAPRDDAQLGRLLGALLYGTIALGEEADELMLDLLRHRDGMSAAGQPGLSALFARNMPRNQHAFPYANDFIAQLDAGDILRQDPQRLLFSQRAMLETLDYQKIRAREVLANPTQNAPLVPAAVEAMSRHLSTISPEDRAREAGALFEVAAGLGDRNARGQALLPLGVYAAHVEPRQLLRVVQRISDLSEQQRFDIAFAIAESFTNANFSDQQLREREDSITTLQGYFPEE